MGGTNGASVKFAENLGATPLQITTASGEELLTSRIADGIYERNLTGAGTVGGIPIVGPAGRTKNQNGKPIIEFNGKSIDLSEHVGPDKRIPSMNGVMSHGAIFTSQAWERTKVETKGENGKNGIKVTYSLDFLKDDVLKLFGPGLIKVAYTLEPDQHGNPIFSSDLSIQSTTGEPVYIGSLAQHTFLKADAEDKLETNATKEFAAEPEHPELPTGEIIDIDPKHNFSEAREIHKSKEVGPLEVVLTGYKKDRPEATLYRQKDKLKILSEASGFYKSFLLCNKGDGNLMLEPITASPPNPFPIRDKLNKAAIEPLVMSKDQSMRAFYKLTAVAA